MALGTKPRGSWWPACRQRMVGRRVGPAMPAAAATVAAAARPHRRRLCGARTGCQPARVWPLLLLRASWRWPVAMRTLECAPRPAGWLRWWRAHALGRCPAPFSRPWRLCWRAGRMTWTACGWLPAMPLHGAWPARSRGTGGCCGPQLGGGFGALLWRCPGSSRLSCHTAVGEEVGA